MIDKVREVALKIIVKIEKNEGYSNLVINEFIKENRNSLSDKDVAFISEIVYGVITWKITLDEIIKKYSKIKLKKLSIWILNILRMSIYQIVFLDKIPKSAAVNEGVNLAKRYGHKASSNFTNAILRKVEKKDYEELFEIEDDVERITKTTSMPIWIIKELSKNRNIKEVEEICINLNKKPKINIRINKLKTSIQEVEKILTEEKIQYNKIAEEMPEFLEIEKIKDIENNEFFKKGYFTVQDISAGLTVKILSPKPNEIVLDACSAPGGKTTYIAEMMENKGKIIAGDIYEHRLNLINENCKRLGIDIVETKQIDGTKYQDKYREKYDKILLDVPCLGIGVIRRKPDIKWKKNKEDIKEIIEIQEKILKNCSRYLKQGGELVYSTCSILEEENEKIIEKFLNETKKFEIVNLEKDVKEFKKYVSKKGFLTINPSEKNDGFFICKLIKK